MWNYAREEDVSVYQLISDVTIIEIETEITIF